MNRTIAALEVERLRAVTAADHAANVLTAERDLLAWRKPERTEQQLGLEVTSYASAELELMPPRP
jgi:coenzyme PQQ precursor peptide PqqA